MTGLQPGTVIGDQRYVTVRALSEHGDAEVWSAQDNVRDQLVTLVVLPLSTPTALAVLDAASRSAGVDNPRLARVLDVGRDLDHGYFVEESLDGAVSMTQLASGIGMAAEEVRRLTGEVALALDAAQRRGLHHLGLTPDNVLRMPDGSVKLTGLATQAALAGQDHVGGKRALRRDARGLVALAYAGLTGRWPLGGDVGLPPAPKVVGGVPRPSEIAVGVPADLDAICQLTLNQNLGPVSPGDYAAQIAPWPSMSVPDNDALAIPGPGREDDSLEIPVLGAPRAGTESSASALSTPPPAGAISPSAGAPDPEAMTRPGAADLTAPLPISPEPTQWLAGAGWPTSGPAAAGLPSGATARAEAPAAQAPAAAASAGDAPGEPSAGAEAAPRAGGWKRRWMNLGQSSASASEALDENVDPAAGPMVSDADSSRTGAASAMTGAATGAAGGVAGAAVGAANAATGAVTAGASGAAGAASGPAGTSGAAGAASGAADTSGAAGAASGAADTSGAAGAASGAAGAASGATTAAADGVTAAATGAAGAATGAAARVAGAVAGAGAAGRRLAARLRGSVENVGDRARTATSKAEGAVSEHRELKAAIRRVEADSEVSIDQAPQQPDLEPPVPLLPPESGAQPTRAQSRFVLATFAAAVALAGIVAGAVAFRPPKSDLEAILGPDTVHPTTSASTSTATTTSAPSGGGEAMPIVGATGYDPEGDGAEYNDLAPRVYDEDPATYWQSEGYQGPKFGGLKSGVGLIVDLGQDVTPSSVELTLPNASSLELYLGSEPDRAGANRIGTVVNEKGKVTVPVTDGATGRYVIVWFTDTPLVSDGRYRAMLSEISVIG